MIVVADSSPLHYLILLQEIDLLHHVYAEVVVPEPVADELRAVGSPRRVNDWMSRPPSWLIVVAVMDEEIASITSELDLG